MRLFISYTFFLLNANHCLSNNFFVMISDGLLALKIKGLLHKCIFGQIFSLFLKSGIRPVISGRPYIRCKESKIFALKCCKLKWYSLKTHWVNFFFFWTAKTVQYFHSSKRQPRWVRPPNFLEEQSEINEWKLKILNSKAWAGQSWASDL